MSIVYFFGGGGGRWVVGVSEKGAHEEEERDRANIMVRRVYFNVQCHTLKTNSVR